MKSFGQLLPQSALFLIILSSFSACAKSVLRPTDLRSEDAESVLPFGLANQTKAIECHDVHSAHDKCAFIRQNCQDEHIGLFNYLEFYYCRLDTAKGLAFSIISLWLGMLFMTIGIAASDFFCVNLSTIASILGMSESVAGVTFLAFGNGSPDVFSTFAAMKIDSGSLAVGELIGAAGFIAAVVAGSMAIVRPFKVGRKSFVRDVSFFAVAVLFGLFFLADGEIHMWECVAMIAFYFCYVAFVIAWHWITGRKKHKRQKERRMREHYTAPEEEVLLTDGVDEDGGIGGENHQNYIGHDFNALENAMGDDLDDADELEQREYAELSNSMRINRPVLDRKKSPTTPHSIRPSLVGALEFRAVLNSLQKTKNLQGRQIHLRRYSDDLILSTHEPSAEPTLDDLSGEPDQRHRPQSLLPPPRLAGRHRAVSVNDINPNRPRINIPDFLVQYVEDAAPAPQDLQPQVPVIHLDQSNLLSPLRSNGSTSSLSPVSSDRSSPLSAPQPNSMTQDSDIESLRITLSPVVHRTSPSPTSIRLPQSSTDTASSLDINRELLWEPIKYWPYAILPSPQLLFRTFFPTLRGFADKSFLEKVFALIAMPSVFLLTLTLPIIEGPNKSSVSEPTLVHGNGLPPESPTSLVSATTGATTPQITEIHEEEQSPKDWNRWLVATQCIASPVFMVFVLFGDGETPLLNQILYALVVGLICLALLLITTEPDHPPRLQSVFCFAGFVVSICWISTVAEEVVGILKAFGIIFGISDAILGLTVFAVGNSLGDLVADITIARLGFPVMALSACFGGPMLNILLGIGISGLYKTLIKGNVYRIEVSSTLVISAATLLITLVVLLVWVPLNDWMMSRMIGWTLIGIWAVGTIVNVVVEISGAHHHLLQH